MEQDKRVIYVCAPLRGNDVGAFIKLTIRENIELAKGYCQRIISSGHIPICTHVMFDGVLNDEVPAERQAALEIGQELLRNHCDAVWVFGSEYLNGVSAGMREEIDMAITLGKPVTFVYQSGYNEPPHRVEDCIICGTMGEAAVDMPFQCPKCGNIQ